MNVTWEPQFVYSKSDDVVYRITVSLDPAARRFHRKLRMPHVAPVLQGLVARCIDTQCAEKTVQDRALTISAVKKKYDADKIVKKGDVEKRVHEDEFLLTVSVDPQLWQDMRTEIHSPKPKAAPAVAPPPAAELTQRLRSAADKQDDDADSDGGGGTARGTRATRRQRQPRRLEDGDAPGGMRTRASKRKREDKEEEAGAADVATFSPVKTRAQRREEGARDTPSRGLLGAVLDAAGRVVRWLSPHKRRRSEV